MSLYINHYQDHVQRIAEFQELKADLVALQNSVNTLPTGGGAGCIFTSLTKYVSDYYIPVDVFNAYNIDLLYLLGAINIGWDDPSNSVLSVIAANCDVAVSLSSLFRRDLVSTQSNAEFIGTTPISITIEFFDMEINLKAIAWMTPYFDQNTPTEQPITIEIYGSNDDITYTLLSQWSRPQTVDSYVWNGHILPVITTHYKYLKFTAPTASPSGNYNLNSGGIRLFGEILL